MNIELKQTMYIHRRAGRLVAPTTLQKLTLGTSCIPSTMDYVARTLCVWRKINTDRR